MVDRASKWSAGAIPRYVIWLSIRWGVYTVRWMLTRHRQLHKDVMISTISGPHAQTLTHYVIVEVSLEWL